jgi:hypothetical protein
MFASIVSLLKGDLDRQVSWAKKEFSRQAGTAALKAGLATGAGIAVLGTVIVGLIWARYGNECSVRTLGY